MYANMTLSLSSKEDVQAEDVEKENFYFFLVLVGAFLLNLTFELGLFHLNNWLTKNYPFKAQIYHTLVIQIMSLATIFQILKAFRSLLNDTTDYHILTLNIGHACDFILAAGIGCLFIAVFLVFCLAISQLLEKRYKRGLKLNAEFLPVFGRDFIKRYKMDPDFDFEKYVHIRLHQIGANFVAADPFVSFAFCLMGSICFYTDYAYLWAIFYGVGGILSISASCLFFRYILQDQTILLSLKHNEEEPTFPLSDDDDDNVDEELNINDDHEGDADNDYVDINDNLEIERDIEIDIEKEVDDLRFRRKILSLHRVNSQDDFALPFTSLSYSEEPNYDSDVIRDLQEERKFSKIRRILQRKKVRSLVFWTTYKLAQMFSFSMSFVVAILFIKTKSWHAKWSTLVFFLLLFIFILCLLVVWFEYYGLLMHESGDPDDIVEAITWTMEETKRLKKLELRQRRLRLRQTKKGATESGSHDAMPNDISEEKPLLLPLE